MGLYSDLMDYEWDIPSGYDSHSHGESTINGGVYGNIIYKWAILHGYVSHNQRVMTVHIKDLA